MNTEELKAETLRILKHIAEMEKWLDACPARDGQPYYETAAFGLEEMRSDVRENALALNDEALRKSMSEYDAHGAFECEAPEWWGNLAKEFAARHNIA